MCQQLRILEGYISYELCCFAEDGNSKGWAPSEAAANTDCGFSHGACMTKGENGIALRRYFTTQRRTGLVQEGVSGLVVTLWAVVLSGIGAICEFGTSCRLRSASCD